MPILWRYILKPFLQIFFLSSVGLICVLLLTRIQDIARFATISGSLAKTLLFTSCQIPYILPFALPISLLIATMLLLGKLSQTSEITALRSAGISLHQIKIPIFFFALSVALFNFMTVSELGPYCRFVSKQMLYKLTAFNPLFMLQKNKQLKLKNSYIDMEQLEMGRDVKHLIFATKHQDRISLVMAKNLSLDGADLIGEHLSYITTLPSKESEPLDHLIIENETRMRTPAPMFSALLNQSSDKPGSDHIPFKKLLRKIKKTPASEVKTLAKAKYELSRRLFFPLVTLAFPVLGIAFGMHIGRKSKTRRVLYALLLASFCFICFLTAKSLYAYPNLSFAFYVLIPHPLLICIALYSERKLARGIE